MSNDNVSNLLEEYKEFGLQFRYYAAEISTANRLMLPPLIIGLLVLYGEVEKFVGVELKNPEAVHRLVWFGCLIISLMWVFNVSRLAQMMHVVLNHLKKRESELIKEDITIAKMDEKMEKKMRFSKMLRHHTLRLIGFGIYFSLLLIFLLESIFSYNAFIPRVAIIVSGILSIWIWYFYFKQPFRTSNKTPIRWQHVVSIILLLIPLALPPFLGKVTRTPIHGIVRWVVIEAIVAGLLIWIWYFYFKQPFHTSNKTPIRWQHVVSIIILLTLMIGLLTFFLENLQTQPDAHAHITCGLKYYEKGQYAEAIEEYTKAIEIKPDYAKAYALRGEAHRANGEDDKSNKDWSMVKALRGGQ